jgi:hypothetical protein
LQPPGNFQPHQIFNLRKFQLESCFNHPAHGRQAASDSSCESWRSVRLAHFEDTILAKKAITVGDTTMVIGRLLSQTAVTLGLNTVTQPSNPASAIIKIPPGATVPIIKKDPLGPFLLVKYCGEKSMTTYTEPFIIFNSAGLIFSGSKRPHSSFTTA